jgi:hypothetical protein
VRSNCESISHYKDSNIYEGVTLFVLNGVHHDENWEGYKGIVMYCSRLAFQSPCTAGSRACCHLPPALSVDVRIGELGRGEADSLVVGVENRVKPL